MLMRRIIPCLDVHGGRVVKGVQFQALRDAGDPVELAGFYVEQGADELVLLDISATPEGREHALSTVRAVRRKLTIPLTVGGGVRELHDAGALLEAGADKVAVNTAAVTRPGLLREMAREFGCQCTVLALDAARDGDRWQAVVRSGSERLQLDVVEWARTAVEAGAGAAGRTSCAGALTSGAGVGGGAGSGGGGATIVPGAAAGAARPTGASCLGSSSLRFATA